MLQTFADFLINLICLIHIKLDFVKRESFFMKIHGKNLLLHSCEAYFPQNILIIFNIVAKTTKLLSKTR